MTAATLPWLLVNRSPYLRTRLMANAEYRGLDLGDIRNVARIVVIVTVMCELALAVVLSPRLRVGHGLAWDTAA